MTVTSTGGCCFCFAAGGGSRIRRYRNSRTDLDRVALSVAHLDAMGALDPHLVHLNLEAGRAVIGAAVGAGADQEVRACVARGAKQFVDVALAVPNVDAAARLSWTAWISSSAEDLR